MRDARHIAATRIALRVNMCMSRRPAQVFVHAHATLWTSGSFSLKGTVRLLSVYLVPIVQRSMTHLSAYLFHLSSTTSHLPMNHLFLSIHIYRSITRLLIVCVSTCLPACRLPTRPVHLFHPGVGKAIRAQRFGPSRRSLRPAVCGPWPRTDSSRSGHRRPVHV